ncbi:MAG: hypothetical protein M0P64_00335 [Candidatus Pacebacteria bacterium]|jgi:hypothetical protein|nr:hypothetical protein [Candidatus Paceibacterota bacterium]
MGKVLFNYFEFEDFLKKIKELSEADPAVAPLFRALYDQIHREEFLCKADRENRCVFGNQRLSPAVKSRYYQVQKAFKDCYGWGSAPEV